MNTSYVLDKIMLDKFETNVKDIYIRIRTKFKQSINSFLILRLNIMCLTQLFLLLVNFY